MYHVFQTSPVIRGPGSGEPADGPKTSRPAGSRRISTSNACVECRRRKIRCDGAKPCSQCQWYQHPEACNYSKPTQRVVPSRKLVEKLSSTIEQYQTVISRLFPSKTIESLSSLPREDLLNLALSLPTSSSTPPVGGGPHNQRTKTQSRSDATDSLDTLEQAADQEDERLAKIIKPISQLQSVSDDVNGLSMSIDRHTSYVGISSITAAMKVIMKAAPGARAFVTATSTDTGQPSRACSPPPEEDDDEDPAELPALEEGKRLIASYFEYVHPFFPMLDEKAFKKTYLHNERSDASWLALLNMVFALGSLAANTSENMAHLSYFKRTRALLNMEHMLPGTLERLHTLGMMGGYYMHYLNRPNEAHAIMQAALSLACSLGLHREYLGANTSGMAGGADGSKLAARPGPRLDSRAAETRRRSWWSLYCLEAWATTTSGRPSIGTSPAITVREPGTAPHQSLDPNDTESLKTLPLIHNSAFCKISLKLQDRLATTPLLPFEELLQFDKDIVSWYDELPSMLTTDNEDSIPSYLRTPRSIMKWRFQNLRIVLHRPFLLSTALKRTSLADMTAEERIAVNKCRQAAEQTIEDISEDIREELISGWNGVWLAYQAAFVPLISLFTDDSSPEDAHKWHASVATVLSIFERMRHYSVAAKVSYVTINRLHEAAKAVIEQRETEKRQLAEMKREEEARLQSQTPGNSRLGKLRTESLDSGEYYFSGSGTSAEGSQSPHESLPQRSTQPVKLEPRPHEPLALAPEYHGEGARLQQFAQANQMQPGMSSVQVGSDMLPGGVMQVPVENPQHQQHLQAQAFAYPESIDMSFNGVWDDVMWDNVPMNEDAFGLADFAWDTAAPNQAVASWGWST